MTPQDIISGIIEREGSTYTNDPADAGGPTKYGITQATLAGWRGRPVSPEEVAALTEGEARQIYLHRYFLGPCFDRVATVSMAIAIELMDTEVNMPPGTAGKWLQRALNALNDSGRQYADLLVDGQLGPKSIDALHAYIVRRGAEGERVLLQALNHLQGARYIELAELRPANERFVYGWLKNRAAA